MPDRLHFKGSPDSVRVRAFYVEDGHPHFWIVAPVRDGARRVGMSRASWRISGGKAADATIEALAGPGVVAYLPQRLRLALVDTRRRDRVIARRRDPKETESSSRARTSAG